MKQQLGLYLVQLGENPAGLLLGMVVLLALAIVCAIVLASLRDMKFQRAWARRSARHFPTRRPQHWNWT
jgi:hypothetical protein